MGSVLLLLVIGTVCYLFWMQRKQDERAIVVARQLCQQQQLHSTTDPNGRKGIPALHSSIVRPPKYHRQ